MNRHSPRRPITCWRGALAGLLLLATGCSAGVPSSPAATESASLTTSVDQTAALVAEIFTRYNDLNNVALAAHRLGDASGWPSVDAEAVLDWDLFDTRLRALIGPEPGEPTDRLLYVPDRVVGAPRAAYPRWVLVGVSGRWVAHPSTSTPTPTRDPASPDAQVVTMVQQAPEAPWLMTGSVSAWSADIPTGDPGPDASAQQLRAATDAAISLGRWWSTGEAAAGLDAQRAQMTRTRLVQAPDFAPGDLSCSLYSGTPADTGINPVVRAVIVGDSLVISTTYRCERVMPGRKGFTVSWDPGYDKIFAPPKKNVLRQPGLIGALLVSDLSGSQVRVAGVRWAVVIP